MTIEEIALAIAAEWQMGFDGIELDFALEVAKRAVADEREACAKTAEQETRLARTSLPNILGDDGVSHCHVAAAIRARSNAGIHRAAKGRPVE